MKIEKGKKYVLKNGAVVMSVDGYVEYYIVDSKGITYLDDSKGLYLAPSGYGGSHGEEYNIVSEYNGIYKEGDKEKLDKLKKENPVVINADNIFKFRFGDEIVEVTEDQLRRLSKGEKVNCEHKSVGTPKYKSPYPSDIRQVYKNYSKRTKKETLVVELEDGTKGTSVCKKGDPYNEAFGVGIAYERACQSLKPYKIIGEFTYTNPYVIEF